MRFGFVVGGTAVLLVSTTLSDVRGEAPDTSPKDKPGATIRVGPNVQVSKARATREHLEVVIAADPTNATRLLAGSMMLAPKGRGGIGLAAYRSSDGGTTWQLAFEREPAKNSDVFADPAVLYGPDGSAYYAALAPFPGHRFGRLELHRSRDGGRGWQEPIQMGQDVDRPFLAVDRTRQKSRGRLYCNCLVVEKGRKNRPGVYTSRDAGRTLGPPRSWVVNNDRGIQTGQGGVLSDGTLVIPYRVNNPPKLIKKDAHTRSDVKGNPFTYAIRLVRSTTGGESFRDEQSVWAGAYLPGGYPVIPMLALDATGKAFKDRLYLVWSHKTRAGRRVLLTLSRDKGATWTRPVVLSEQPDRAGGRSYDSVLPAVAVNRAGVVGVSWYDGRDGREGKPRCHLRFRASLDGGETWLPSVRVTDRPSPFDLDSVPQRSFLGDTSGLAADAAGDFHPLWIDSRTGTRQVFTTTVRVKAP